MGLCSCSLRAKRVHWSDIWEIIELSVVERLYFRMLYEAPVEDTIGNVKIYLTLTFGPFFL